MLLKTSEAIDFVSELLKRPIYNSRWSTWKTKRWIAPEKTVHRTDYYSMSDLRSLPDTIDALPLIVVADIMTNRIGYKITPDRIKQLCDLNMVEYVRNPFRIPSKTLPDLQEAITLQHNGISPIVARTLITHAGAHFPQKELSSYLNITPSKLSKIKHGKLKLSLEIYELISELIKWAEIRDGVLRKFPK
jgi:hypothetical protein